MPKLESILDMETLGSQHVFENNHQWRQMSHLVLPRHKFVSQNNVVSHRMVQHYEESDL